jgi:hypothetical protein
MKVLKDEDLTPELLKKKQKMFLSMAISAVWWGEGSDFEWQELVADNNYEETIAEVYGVKYPNEYDAEYDDDEDGKKFDKAWDAWTDLQGKVQSDVSKFLKKLKESL